MGRALNAGLGATRPAGRHSAAKRPRRAAIARPTIVVVNNAQREHQEFMHTVEAVARENGAVLQALSRDGVAVFPADDTYTPIWRDLAQGRTVIDFATEGEAAVTVSSCDWVAEPTPHWQLCVRTPMGEATFSLHMAGQHNVRNALAATAAALGAGVPLTLIAQGLQTFEPVKGRSQLRSLTLHGRALTLVDDSYNANPDSVRAAIEVLAELPGPQLLVLGDMGEVGDQGPEFHAEAGALAHAAGIPLLFALGAQSVHAASAYGNGQGGVARHFNEIGALLDAVRQALPTVGSVLVKGSRFMKMEQVVGAIAAAAPPQEQQQKSMESLEGPHGATH